ncbi:MgtC/SapB family protein [Candidatus Micrarchaeota archaeon]|nr:MgtC/SapB family protein [Candidatus Micrarchaeota archaeon]
MLLEDGTAVKLIAAALVGLLIGYARRQKAAGMRTFALLCLGSAIFSVISITSSWDPMRVIAQIVAGIGFLGLGVIWKNEGKPVGLTTAAAIWVTAAIGVLIGIGMWMEAGLGTVLTLGIVYSKKPLNKIKI